MKWISVEDELPGLTHCPVLVDSLDGYKGVYMAAVSGSEIIYIHGIDANIPLRFAYWFPLPLSPIKQSE